MGPGRNRLGPPRLFGTPRLTRRARLGEKLDGHQGPPSQRDQLVRVLQKEFSKRAVDEWVEEIRSAGVSCGPVNSLADVFGDEHVLGSGILQGVGILWMPLRTPPRLSARRGGSGLSGPKTTSHSPWVGPPPSKRSSTGPLYRLRDSF